MRVNEIAKEINRNAKEKGLNSSDRMDFPRFIALCHSEISEAYQDYKNAKPHMFYRSGDEPFCKNFENHNGEKPEGYAIELIDCVLAIFSYCVEMGWDVEELISIKHDYNVTRPYKHGDKIC